MPPHWSEVSLEAIASKHYFNVGRLFALPSKTQGFTVPTHWSEVFLTAIAPKARTLRDARSYPALLYGLSRLGMPLQPNLLDTITAGLLSPSAPAPVSKAGSKSKKAAAAVPSVLAVLDAEDLGVVLTVLGAAPGGYRPPAAFVNKLLEALQDQVGVSWQVGVNCLLGGTSFLVLVPPLYSVLWCHQVLTCSVVNKLLNALLDQVGASWRVSLLPLSSITLSQRPNIVSLLLRPAQ